jgi:hypothetical protein
MAKNVVGVSGYGAAMGREAVKNGIVLGRTLYLGHGTRAKASNAYVFEDEGLMRSEDFEPYCMDMIHRPPMEDSSELSKHSRTAGIAFATHCALTASSNFMQEANVHAFHRSLGSGTKEELLKLGLGITFDHILHYLGLPTPPGVTQVVSFEEPGTSDLLGVVLREVAAQVRDRAVVFQRAGSLGFGAIVVHLAEDTSRVILLATQKYGW